MPSQNKPQKGQRNENIAENVLQGASLTLQTVQQVAVFTTVPYLSDAAGLVLKIFEIVQAVKDNKTAFQALANEAANVFSVLLQSYRSQSPADNISWPPSGLESTVEDLIRTLKEIIKLVDQYKLRSILPRILSSKTDPGKLQELQKKMQSSITAFELQSHLTINTKLSELLSSQLTHDAEAKRNASLAQQAQAMEKLEKRRHAGAGYDSAERSDVPRCLPETREAIIANATNWIENAEDDQTLLWLYGPAGCGKTTLAQTISLHCQNAERLATSFFFSNSAANRPKTQAEFVVTLTYQLCISIPELLEFVTATLIKDPGILDRDLSRQMEALIIGPLNRLLEHQDPSNLEPKHWWLLLVDGLDECEGAENQKEVLKVLSIALHQLSFPLRIIISSRPEYAIQSTITSKGIGKSTIWTIPLDNDYQTREDIKKFIMSRFEEIKQKHPSRDYFSADWPYADDVDTLNSRSQGLFIYVSLVMKYVESDDDDPPNRLQDILKFAVPPSNDHNDLPFAQLDLMYTHILSKIPSRKRQKVRDILNWMILDSSSYWAEDKSPTFCNSLFGLMPGETQRLLKDLTSVIHIPNQEELGLRGNLRFFHASFQDFLQDPLRAGSKAPDFVCSANEGHARLAVMWICLYGKTTMSFKPLDTGGEDISAHSLARQMLMAILWHCQNTALLDVLQGPLGELDLRPSLVMDLGGNKYSWWRRVFLLLKLLSWLNKQEPCKYKENLYCQHFNIVQTMVHHEWSQYPPEIQHYIPLLLMFEKNELFPHSGEYPSLDMESRTLMGQILASLNQEADTLFFKGKNKMTQLAFWLADILQSKTHVLPFQSFFSKGKAFDFLAEVLKKAPVDLLLEVRLRTLWIGGWQARGLSDSLHEYFSKCRDFERKNQLKCTTPELTAEVAAAQRCKGFLHPALVAGNNQGLLVGVAVVVIGILISYFWLKR